VLLAARNIVKAWLLVLALTGAFALVGWLLGDVQGLSIFVFCALLVAAGAYWSFDRVVLGMLGARELPLGEAPLLHSSVERLAARAGIAKPRLYLVPDGLPIVPRLPSARAASRPARRPNSRACSRMRSPTCDSTTSRSRQRPRSLLQ
jgi:hypothetical protein